MYVRTLHTATTSVLANILSLCMYVAMTTKPVKQLQIKPIVYNSRALPATPQSYIWLCSAMWQGTDAHRRQWPQHILLDTTSAFYKVVPKTPPMVRPTDATVQDTSSQQGWKNLEIFLGFIFLGFFMFFKFCTYFVKHFQVQPAYVGDSRLEIQLWHTHTGYLYYVHLKC